MNFSIFVTTIIEIREYFEEIVMLECHLRHMGLGVYPLRPAFIPRGSTDITCPKQRLGCPEHTVRFYIDASLAAYHCFLLPT